MQDLPDAFCALDHWSEEQGRRPIALFLDFDGTVTPIVARPDQATLGSEMRVLIGDLALRCQVAFVTGRDLEDIRALVGLESLSYAGSHGFSVLMVDGCHEEFGQPYLDALASADEALRAGLDDSGSILIERKRFAISVHTRGAGESATHRAAALVDLVLSNHPDLMLGRGKSVFELRPAMNWHKGRAMSWMLQRWQQDQGVLAPIFIGDDVTDEDAFAELGDRGMSILVGSHGQATKANYGLANVAHVKEFLERLLKSLKTQQ